MAKKEETHVFSARIEQISYAKVKPTALPDPHEAPANPGRIRRRPPGRWYYVQLQFTHDARRIELSKIPVVLGTAWRLYQERSDRNTAHVNFEQGEAMEVHVVIGNIYDVG